MADSKVDHVFILGAGTSYEAGAPLMANFLDEAENLLLAGFFGNERNEIERVFKARHELQRAHTKAQLDLINIESLFCAIEMASVISKLGNYKKKEITAAKNALIKLIVRTLELSTPFKKGHGNTGYHVSGNKETSYGFESLIQKISTELGAERCSVINFNYDIIFEAIAYFYALKYPEYPSGKINYGFGPSAPNSIKLLKLHGSLNWFLKRGSNSIVPIQLEDYDKLNAFQKNSGIFQIEFSKIRGVYSKKNNIPLKENPVIVPPTWNKTHYNNTLAKVWCEAANDLSNARYIYVIGYSLPETDLFFKYLYALGTISDTNLRVFKVFNPDSSESIIGRYKNILGPEGKYRFDFITRKFSSAMDYLSKEFPSNIKFMK